MVRQGQGYSSLRPPFWLVLHSLPVRVARIEAEEAQSLADLYDLWSAAGIDHERQHVRRLPPRW